MLIGGYADEDGGFFSEAAAAACAVGFAFGEPNENALPAVAAGALAPFGDPNEKAPEVFGAAAAAFGEPNGNPEDAAGPGAAAAAAAPPADAFGDPKENAEGFAFPAGDPNENPDFFAAVGDPKEKPPVAMPGGAGTDAAAAPVPNRGLATASVFLAPAPVTAPNTEGAVVLMGG